MDPITRQAIAVAGGAGGGDPLYVDDVFSTFLYEGSGSNQTIVNGLDLAGEGGMVWNQVRNSSNGYPTVYDTENGTGPNGGRFFAGFSGQSVPGTQSNGLQSFNSNGVTLGSNIYENGTNTTYGTEYALWSFRKAPGFFDVLTYTGDGVNGRQISHSLGSTPGMSIIKCTTTSARDWIVRHQDMSSGKVCFLNTTDSELTNPGGYQTHSSTHLTLNSGSAGLQGVNNSGDTYVAYIFAHDDQSFGTNSDEAIVKCGSFNANSNGHYTVDLGFEPQFLLIKSASNTGAWFVADNMRGIETDDVALLRANQTNAEDTFPGDFSGQVYLNLRPNGFESTRNLLGASQTFIYMAIRRPHKPPTAGTEVFKPVSVSATLPHEINVGFPADFAIQAVTEHGGSRWVLTRQLGNGYLTANATNAFSPLGSTFYVEFDRQNSLKVYLSGSNGVFWNFRRAPGFFDVLNYLGDGTINRTVPHNLGVVPELVIIKRRSSSGEWWVDAGAAESGKVLYLSRESTAFSYTAFGTHTATTVGLETAQNNDTNQNTGTYIAYLFATLDGISKVGSYTGTGYDVNVDCGFTAGARFVLIKRTDSTGDWYAWDTARGIVSGNDPYLLVNSTAAQVTNTDYVDPLNAGFTVTSSAPAALNASGGTYLFLAIA